MSDTCQQVSEDSAGLSCVSDTCQQVSKDPGGLSCVWSSSAGARRWSRQGRRWRRLFLTRSRACEGCTQWTSSGSRGSPCLSISWGTGIHRCASHCLICPLWLICIWYVQGVLLVTSLGCANRTGVRWQSSGSSSSCTGAVLSQYSNLLDGSCHR
jgi:hypothetical protein